jgi:hypothetical protein
MKKINGPFPRLLAIGLLLMNIWLFVNHFIKIDDDIIDFFKGFGFALIFVSIIKLVKMQKYKHSDQS